MLWDLFCRYFPYAAIIYVVGGALFIAIRVLYMIASLIVQKPNAYSRNSNDRKDDEKQAVGYWHPKVGWVSEDD